MGFFDSFFGSQSRAIPAAAPEKTRNGFGAFAMSMNSKAYQRGDGSFKSSVEKGYEHNAIVFRCINEIASGAAAIKFKVFVGDEESPDHPLMKLLEHPNPLQSRVEYFQALYSYMLLSGNNFSLRVDVNEMPHELHILRPDRVDLEVNDTPIPLAYKYKLGGKVVAKYPVDQMNGRSVVKHIKLFHPMNDHLGMSPLSAAMMDIDHHNSIMRHNIALVENGARPSALLVFKPIDETGAPATMTDEQRQTLNRDLEQEFTGERNAGKPIVAEGDMHWQQMGISPKDMDFANSKNMAAKDIALCYGVPAQLIGLPDSMTYINVREARLSLYEETIIPHARRVESDLNEWLAPLYGDNVKIKYDFDAIPAMTERRRRRIENLIEVVQAGLMTINEAREELNMSSDMEGGDTLFMPQNFFPVDKALEMPDENSGSPEQEGRQAYGPKA